MLRQPAVILPKRQRRRQLALIRMLNTAERAARVFARENLKYDSAAKDLLALGRAYDIATAALQQGQTDIAGYTRLMDGATAATRRNKEVVAEQAAVAKAAAQAQIAEAARVDAAMAQYAAMAAKRQQDAIAMEERAAAERQRNASQRFSQRVDELTASLGPRNGTGCRI